MHSSDSAGGSQFEMAAAVFLDAAQRGETLDRQELLNAYPEAADDLQRLFSDHDRMLRRVGRGSATESRDAAGEDVTVALTSPLALIPQGRELGDYVLLEELGRGGMGVIHRAYQKSLRRIVAIKFVLGGKFSQAHEVQRFRSEALAAAKLKHPHIVVVYEVGELDGQPFFAMEYIEGKNLSQLARERQLSVKSIVQYVRQIAAAIHYAHQQGVLHRDLKPSNVLIDRDDQARVMDFGLAKQLDGSDALTGSCDILGTPAYMAPEQISRRYGKVAPSTDVYALGVMLYELLTGEMPLGGVSDVDTMFQTLDREPRPPRDANPNVPRELEWICLKCLEKKPEHRYATAQQLADDLGKFLTGDSISVSSRKVFDRVFRTLERSQFDQECATWSRMLLHFAWIALVGHGFAFLAMTLPSTNAAWFAYAARAAELAAIGAVVTSLRRQWYPPRGAAARQLAALVFGYMAGSAVLQVIPFFRETDFPPDPLKSYPPMAVLASLVFVTLGSSYWGYCYVLGAVFLTLALTMAAWPAIAPLLFGAAWATSLVLLGRRLLFVAADTE